MFQTSQLYQNDPQWKDVKLGNQGKETIGTWGCLLTSMTMVLNGFGHQETPVTVNDKMKNNGGFQGALVFPYMLAQIYPGVVFKGYDPCEQAPAPLSKIDAALTAGHPVIVQVDWSPKPELQTHWVVLKEKKGSDYVMYDPYQYPGDIPQKELLLTQRYKYSGADPAKAITGVVWFEKIGAPPAPPAPEPKAPIPADKLTLFTSEDDLALRAEPTTSGALIRRLPRSTPLICLETKEVVKSKLGQYNQWLFVQDPAGDQGYTAAWYVSTEKDTAPTPPLPPAPGKPPASSLVVTPTTDGLAFRSQPIPTPETLIKRLPITAELLVLEQAAQAVKKIGVEGQWIKVKEITGQEGYVAAWYVTPSDNPALGVREPVSAPETPPEDQDQAQPLIVRTTDDAVALRSQPLVSEASLIKRMLIRAELLVIEENARAKIGVMGQWLKVRDLQGVEGYVAAWYVSQ